MHIDDPRSVGSMLPSFTHCLSLKPSTILKDFLGQLMRAYPIAVEVDEFADMPELEEDRDNDDSATIPVNVAFTSCHYHYAKAYNS